jgi:alpha-galactosidase
MAVAIFNRGDEPAQGSVSWNSLKMGKNLKVRDLWKHEAIATNGDSYTANVPAHGVVLLRVSKANKH